MTETPWYRQTKEQVLKNLNTSLAGLSSSSIPDRVSRYGKNVLPSGNKLTLVRVILNQFLSPLIYVLLAAAIVSMILGEYSDAVFIFLVLFINAVIGAFQEWKAEAKASALEQLIKLKTKTNRGGRTLTINSEELVPGDIVMLESGNKVPADIRILKAKNLNAIEAILTGESMAVDKQSDVIKEETAIPNRFNMLFAGTSITTGRITGVVVCTGVETEIGKIASSLIKLKTGKTPLAQRMETFTKKISLIILSACLILSGLGYLSGISLQEIFFFAIAMAVSAIPEGLPIAMTISLSLGASQMAKRNVIIRKLIAVEGLGSCTFIATDKTGTITVDQQTAKAIILPGTKTYTVTGEGYNSNGIIIRCPDGEEVSNDTSPDLERMIQSVVICNEGELTRVNGSWNYSGNPIDVALLALSYKNNTAPDELLHNIEKVYEIPFESEKQYSAVYYREKGLDTLQIAVKGALEKIKAHIDQEKNSALLDEALRYAEKGYRIITVGGATVDDVTPGDELPELELLGFICMIDPLRPEAKPAVGKCHRAGVEVAMVTGDHPATALSIAREVGIANNEDELITGEELDIIIAQGKASFKKILQNKRVFSRVTPQQKQIIVQSLRETGHFIAVTGDGVNDAPALKTANISVAMGSGTDVAKDTSSIIISDNNFASIVTGIEEGRFTYANLRKIIFLLISTGIAELVTISLSLAFQLPLPFLPVQLLWLNLVTNGIQDVALAFEAGEKKVMSAPPRKPDEKIFDRLMINQTLLATTVISLLTFALWYHLINNLHWEVAVARNTVLFLMVLLQNFHALNCRSETRSIFKIPISNNYILVIGILAAQSVHILALHIPFMQELLSLQPLPWRDWVKLFFIASVLVVAMEVFKYVHAQNINLFKKHSGKSSKRE